MCNIQNFETDSRHRLTPRNQETKLSSFKELILDDNGSYDVLERRNLRMLLDTRKKK